MSKVIKDTDLLNDSKAQALLSAFRDSTDPKYVGPGTWNVIHRLAYAANTVTKQQQFINLMKEICYTFGCLNCREHCTEYIRQHPLEQAINVTVATNGRQLPLGMFVWSWKFHNAVNARLKKPLMSWRTALNLYAPHKMYTCSDVCSDSEGDQEENLTVTTTRPTHTTVTYY